jgi:hypothetical protein
MWKITRWTAKMATSSCKAATRGMPAAHGVASSVRPRTNGPRLAPVEKPALRPTPLRSSSNAKRA